MKIYVKSNFVIPGLEGGNSINIDHSRITLRKFLDELSMKSPNLVFEYKRASAETLDPDDWEVDINGIPYEFCTGGLEAVLNDGDTVAVRTVALGGG